MTKKELENENEELKQSILRLEKHWKKLGVSLKKDVKITPLYNMDWTLYYNEVKINSKFLNKLKKLWKELEISIQKAKGGQ